MPGNLQLKRVLLGQIAALWVVSAMAAETTLNTKDITSIPLSAIAMAMVLAFIGGLGSTTQKLVKPDIEIPNVPLEIFKDVINSLIAGLCAFFLGAWLEWPPFAQVLMITIAGYGGSRFLEQLLTEVFVRVGTAINGAKKE